jgi:hypothetical protein
MKTSFGEQNERHHAEAWPATATGRRRKRGGLLAEDIIPIRFRACRADAMRMAAHALKLFGGRAPSVLSDVVGDLKVFSAPGYPTDNPPTKDSVIIVCSEVRPVTNTVTVYQPIEPAPSKAEANYAAFLASREKKA